MVIKVYLSRVSGNIEMKKRQEFILQIFESRHIDFEEIDISDPSKESDKAFMRENSKPKDGQRVALPPQIFNDQDYCGDFEAFDIANECDELEEFLKLAAEKNVAEAASALAENGNNENEDPNDANNEDD